MKDQEGSVTADDVAAMVGVSRWTVNRAFKKDASISAKSREKVMKAAETLGYVPDLLATSLATDRTNLVALLVDDFANPHKLVMMERLTRILRKNGYDTLLVNTSDEQDASAALLNASQRRVDAAILIGVSFNDQSLETAIGAKRVKKLIVFARMSKNENTISVCCDDRAAMTAITEHVFAAGYRNPFFIAGPQTQSAHLQRKEIFLSQWEKTSGNRPRFASVDRYDPKLAYDLVVQRFKGAKQADLPDVLVCENDALAMGACDAIRYELGLRVPEDIAITGFDDVPQASSPQYELTTYRQPLTDMANALVEVLEGKKRTKKLHAFLGRLVIRKSA
ncbi:LacI family transcriptional regulator [Loktanella sp. 3ANDIMAR09]|uniref:LacI family DNA-binding transcriptional regulator n=1 Tax=Loktanella sp. 3ANDIMAR09 TaxID=1225657 RepID=UPI0007072542|nr:LacI family DNA-binding transcriptional regulator [Loktanella sp. 3ANDIMAR09]KQI70369.1 LacI family transcriptional regulator [Loktanella sp. 3ANDIMAR09]